MFHKGEGCGEQVQMTLQYSLLSTYQSPIQAFSKLEDEKKEKKKNYIVFPLWVRAVFGHLDRPLAISFRALLVVLAGSLLSTSLVRVIFFRK